MIHLKILSWNARGLPRISNQQMLVDMAEESSCGFVVVRESQLQTGTKRVLGIIRKLIHFGRIITYSSGIGLEGSFVRNVCSYCTTCIRCTLCILSSARCALLKAGEPFIRGCASK